MKKLLIMISSTLYICLFVLFATKTLVFADEVSGESTVETSESTTESESSVPSSEKSESSENSTTTETSRTESNSTTESSKETSAEESKESTTPSESNEDSKIFNITEEDIDKIIEAAKQGNIDEVKNLLIGTIGFTAFTILMALIYLVKVKIKQASEAKLLESANEVTNGNIKELAIQLSEITNIVNSKMDDVETSVKNYYQALNSEKVDEATRKAQEIAKALEAAMNLNKTTEEETPQEESKEEIKAE